MTKINPYLAEIRERDWGGGLQNYSDEVLATLAVAHELAEANALTEMINAPRRVVLGSQDPISPEALKSQMAQTKLMTVPDDSGDARLAEAARAAARRHETRSAHPREILADLVRAIDEEDWR